MGLVAKAIRGLSPQVALERLKFLGKSGAGPMIKALKSALANAQNNAKLKAEDLKIKKLEILPGPSFKRWRPVSRGRAHPYKRKTSHIRIVLEGGA